MARRRGLLTATRLVKLTVVIGALSEAGARLDRDRGGGILATGWAVVITRRLPSGLAPGARTQSAFAVWEGGHQEVGARELRTGWLPLLSQKRA